MARPSQLVVTKRDYEGMIALVLQENKDVENFSWKTCTVFDYVVRLWQGFGLNERADLTQLKNEDVAQSTPYLTTLQDAIKAPLLGRAAY